MHRDLKSLADTHFDVAIIGGGSFGAAAARAAALRGLRTALIERADFGAGASAECFKMVHGGIRYLQHADVVRARASCRERSAFLRTAPHLVKPLPIAIPTYGHGRKGKLLLSAGMHAFDALTLDRNRGIRDRERRIARPEFLSRAQAKQLFPLIDDRGLTGAAVFEDGQMYNPARLVLAFVKSAVDAGAVACNYVEATDFVVEGDRVRGVEVRDRLTSDTFAVKANLVLNAAGPWAEYLLRDRSRFGEWRRGPFSRDAYFIINRPPTSKYALAVSGLSKDQDAVLGRATRHLFLVPWRDKTLVGVWHRLFAQHPETARIEDSELQQWLDELNAVNPDLNLKRDEITFGNCGLVPFGEHADEHSMQFGKESRFIDHRKSHGLSGLVTLIGIRYTMARADGERALDMLLTQHPKATKQVDTTMIPLAGGAIENVGALKSRARASHPELDVAAIDSLVHNHGTEFARVVDLCTANPLLRERAPNSAVLAAEIEYAVRNEMAVHLDDVVLRRTDLSGHDHPGIAALEFAAKHMAALLKWSPQRMAEELAATQASLAQHHAKDRSASGDTDERLGSMLAKRTA